VGKPKRKRLLARPTRTWEDNIMVDLKGVGWGGMVWFYVAQGKKPRMALVNTVINLWVLRNVGKFSSS
jgi:hypothetical protein